MGSRSIQHPGPLGVQRLDVVPVGLRRAALLLQPGCTLLEALVVALPGASTSAVLTLHGGRLEPFAYVMPALSKSVEHAVYFSDRFDAAGAVQLDTASVTFGQRDGQPWLHCHARWTDAAGQLHCGHVLPQDAYLAEPMAATAWLLEGGAFIVRPDDETRFTLFRPVTADNTADDTANHTANHTACNTAENAAGARPGLALRLAPNEDVCTALETLCRQRGITRATVRGGVGSTVGALFDDGRRVEPFVTEVLIRQGRVRPGADGAPVAELDVSLVDHTGGLADGRLARGGNAVLVTFELVLELD